MSNVTAGLEFLADPFYTFLLWCKAMQSNRVCCCQTKCHCPHTAALLLFCFTMRFTKASYLYNYVLTRSVRIFSLHFAINVKGQCVQHNIL